MPAPTATPFAETSEEHLGSLVAIARDAGIRHVVLSETASLSWLTGARSQVQNTLDRPCFAIVVDTARAVPAVRAVTSRIEAGRLTDTELRGLFGGRLEVEELPWRTDRRSALPHGDDALWDDGSVGPDDAVRRLIRARRRLSAHQRTLLAEVGAETARVVEDTLRDIRRGDAEALVAGRVSDGLIRRGIDPVVCLVGSDERLSHHRHPLPTAHRIERRVMVSVAGRRNGVIASVTRLLSFEELDPADERRYEALLGVEAAFLDATRDGRPLADAFASGVAAYASRGFDPDEWFRHHQGGLAGFVPREVLAHPGSSEVIDADAVVAWNPSAAGWKVEDSVLVTPTGVVVPPVDADWPRITVAGRHRPGVLIRRSPRTTL